jgi:hypothetical protein
MKKEMIIDIIAALLILLFLYASFSKYADYTTYQRAMYNQPFTHGLAALLLLTIPPVEILFAIFLMIPRTKLWGFYGAFVLMGLFTGYIAAVLLHLFGRVPCSCGGVIRLLNWPQHLLFNLFFTAIAGWGIYLMKEKRNE